MKQICIVLSTIVFAILIYVVADYKMSVNLNPKLSIGECIDFNNHNNIFINKSLKIYYVEKASSDCINPDFPAIHMVTTSKHNAWLQIIFTDSSAPHLQKFIDSSFSNYPFYTFEQDFYDAPIWEYSIISKPLSFWKAHAYAVNLDKENRIIEFVEGAEWGFTFTEFALYPNFVKPRSLEQNDLKQDLQLFSREFDKYQVK